MSGKAGEKPTEDFKVNGQYVNTPEKGEVGIPFIDEYIEKAALEYLDGAAKSNGLFFMSINVMKVHQPKLTSATFGSELSGVETSGPHVTGCGPRIGAMEVRN